jgi:2-iminobutanoate/2-iminopropanoate deaminase
MTAIPEKIYTTAAPAPGGHYSQAVAWNDMVFVSGQLGLRPDGTHTASLPFVDQARQAIANLLATLAAADCDAQALLRVTAYIVGVENWPIFNDVFAQMLADARPARSVVPVPALHYGYLIEIDAIAGRSRDLRPGGGDRLAADDGPGQAPARKRAPPLNRPASLRRSRQL